MREINFDNTYIQLPERFYSKIVAAKFKSPTLLQFNDDLARELNFNLEGHSEIELARIFSGQKILSGSEPIAMAYAGHQFGHFVPQLGDGRAMLLGEVKDSHGRRFDIQLKGAGPTPFSRGGDGRAALGPVIREYIVSEAMHALGVATTRSLAAVATGETVERDRALPGATVTRGGSSHIRIGHFEFFAARKDIDGLRTLANYSIRRHDPTIENAEDKYFEFFKLVVQKQAQLIAHWLDVGFIHGVMNTDNMLISGETIDYGPCAFIDEFSFEKVFSSIDRQGRYAYIQQAPIAQWNLASLAECLLTLYAKPEAHVAKFEAEISNFRTVFENTWHSRMRQKLGLKTSDENDIALIQEWLEYLQAEQLDYTLSFRKLADSLLSRVSFASTERYKHFHTKWLARVKKESRDVQDVAKQMNRVNPIYIARNHQVERAIQAAMNGDLSVFADLLNVLKTPFNEQSGFDVYKAPPRPSERISKTFCGT